MTRITLSKGALFAWVVVICSVLTDACTDEFKSAKCVGLREKDSAMEALHHVCEGVPFASACSIHVRCHGESEDCDWFALLAHACQEFPDQDECKSLSRCGDDPKMVTKCAKSDVLSTDEAYKSVRGMCDMHEMDQCSECKALGKIPTKSSAAEVNKNCSDPLGTLSAMCLAMNGQGDACKSFQEWCKGKESGLCEMSDSETPVAEQSHHHGDHMHDMHEEKEEENSTDEMMGHNHHQAMGHSNPLIAKPKVVALLSTGPCYDDPKSDSCMDFRHPEDAIQQNIKDMCVTQGISMSWMVGCNFWRTCKDEDSTDGFCKPFNILAALCQDMPMMAGCADYNKLCASGTKVKQCRSAGVPSAPTTVALQNAIITACEDHTMPACNQCPRRGADCTDPMATMAELCHTMPSMQFCSDFVDFCSATENAFDELCSPGSNKFLPPMRMYFHTSLRDLILFKDWVPENEGTYILSVMVIILVGVIAQAMKSFRMGLETKWYQNVIEVNCGGVCQPGGQCETDGCIQDCTACDGNGNLSKPSGKKVFMSVPQAKRNVVRALITGVVTTLEYSLMLVAMTFNVGLFLAVIGGFMLGSFLFGHRQEPKPSFNELNTIRKQEAKPFALGNDCCGSNTV